MPDQPEDAVEGVVGEAAANCRGSSTSSVICMTDDAHALISTCNVLALLPMPFSCMHTTPSQSCAVESIKSETADTGIHGSTGRLCSQQKLRHIEPDNLQALQHRVAMEHVSV